ncbi:hypothetical protein WJX84_002786 [Apatococcus fuscideae]|uniref:BZIP domain-containing protein n=1 Tax=Apatococcus fuscideae TaxID=2026836 RepID=A0AAW1SUZ3_9CHLO
MTPLVGSLSFGTRLHLSPTFSGHLLETAAAAQTTRPSSEGGGVLEDPRVRSQSVPVEPAEGEPSGSGGQKARERNKRAQRTFRQRQKAKAQQQEDELTVANSKIDELEEQVSSLEQLLAAESGAFEAEAPERAILLSRLVAMPIEQHLKLQAQYHACLASAVPFCGDPQSAHGRHFQAIMGEAMTLLVVFSECLPEQFLACQSINMLDGTTRRPPQAFENLKVGY